MTDTNAVPQADGDPGNSPGQESATAGIPRTAEEAKVAGLRGTLGEVLVANPEITAEDIVSAKAEYRTPQIRKATSKEEAEALVALQRKRLHERIDNDFTYHPPKDDAQILFYANVRDRFRSLAHFLAENIPPGRELSTALTKLEEASMHANAGMARHG